MYACMHACMHAYTHKVAYMYICISDTYDTYMIYNIYILDHLLASMSVGSIPHLQACKSPRRSACYRSCEGHDPYICDAKMPIHPIMQ